MASSGDVADAKKIGAEVERRDPAAEGGRCRFWNPMVRRASIVALLLAAIGCSVAPMFGVNEGWLYWHKDGVETEASPYVGLLQYILITNPGLGIDPGLVDVLNPLLPHVPADVTATMGWMKSVSKVQLQTEGAERVPEFLRDIALGIVPEEFKDSVNRVVDEGRESLEEDYTGDRNAGLYTGAISIAFLGLSAMYAILCLIMMAINGHSVVGLQTAADWLLDKSWLVGGLLYLMMGLEYIVVAVGTHRELKKHPVVQKGYIAWPDWALIIAIIAASCWAAIAIIMFIHKRAVKKAMTTALRLKPAPAVATKQSWNIPAVMENEGVNAV